MSVAKGWRHRLCSGATYGSLLNSNQKMDLINNRFGRCSNHCLSREAPRVMPSGPIRTHLLHIMIYAKNTVNFGFTCPNWLQINAQYSTGNFFETLIFFEN